MGNSKPNNPKKRTKEVKKVDKEISDKDTGRTLPRDDSKRNKPK